MLWLQRNDVLTRGKLATYVNRGMPGSVAMKQALHETHLEWRSPLAAPLVVSSGSGSPGTTKRKQESSPLPACGRGTDQAAAHLEGRSVGHSEHDQGRQAIVQAVQRRQGVQQLAM